MYCEYIGHCKANISFIPTLYDSLLHVSGSCAVRFGAGNGSIAVGEVICEGAESHLLRCHYKSGSDLQQLQLCQSHSQDVGVVCGEYLSEVIVTKL